MGKYLSPGQSPTNSCHISGFCRAVVGGDQPIRRGMKPSSLSFPGSLLLQGDCLIKDQTWGLNCQNPSPHREPSKYPCLLVQPIWKAIQQQIMIHPSDIHTPECSNPPLKIHCKAIIQYRKKKIKCINLYIIVGPSLSRLPFLTSRGQLKCPILVDRVSV